MAIKPIIAIVLQVKLSSAGSIWPINKESDHVRMWFVLV